MLSIQTSVVVLAFTCHWRPKRAVVSSVRVEGLDKVTLEKGTEMDVQDVVKELVVWKARTVVPLPEGLKRVTGSRSWRKHVGDKGPVVFFAQN